MGAFKFSKITRIASILVFTFYFLYGIFRIPFVKYLTCVAVGSIAYGITDSYEIAVIGLLLCNFVFPNSRYEGFVSAPIRSAMHRDSGTAAFMLGGVGSPMSEGFEDASGNDLTLSPTKVVSENSTDVTATTKPAAVENGLFKLADIPKDQKDGFHIDAGTTVLNALNALKPEQITAMTQDTKQLIETQKSLMNMLKTFTPVVNEGKQMMETFGAMFGPTMGALDVSNKMLTA